MKTLTLMLLALLPLAIAIPDSAAAQAVTDLQYNCTPGQTAYLHTPKNGLASGNYRCDSNHHWNLAPPPPPSLGGVLASASTIAPTSSMQHVSGTTAISTITVPVGFGGGECLTLIPDGLWTTNTSGNIALASTAVVNKALQECWDGSKWYPTY